MLMALRQKPLRLLLSQTKRSGFCFFSAHPHVNFPHVNPVSENPFYNNVGLVKQKITTLVPMRGENCQGRRSWRSSKTLDRFRRASTMKTGTKRNAVQLSFVPYQDSFVGV